MQGPQNAARPTRQTMPHQFPMGTARIALRVRTGKTTSWQERRGTSPKEKRVKRRVQKELNEVESGWADTKQRILYLGTPYTLCRRNSTTAGQ